MAPRNQTRFALLALVLTKEIALLRHVRRPGIVRRPINFNDGPTTSYVAPKNFGARHAADSPLVL